MAELILRASCEVKNLALKAIGRSPPFQVNAIKLSEFDSGCAARDVRKVSDFP
jgi:hypothetical protein